MNRHWRQYCLRWMYLRQWEEIGSLYGCNGGDESEALTIREQCEAHGVPMGYGRVLRAPLQLSTNEERGPTRARRT